MQLNCQTCHSLFETDPTVQRELFQHTNIRLNHGLNDRCLNCHSTKNRDYLVLNGEREIPFGEVELLCAKCHGPTYRDWQKGIHGKTLGSWESGNPAQRRLKCTECHDPHSPAFEHIVPLPGPHTLRMGPQSKESPEHRKRNVLQLWRAGSADHQSEKDL